MCTFLIKFLKAVNCSLNDSVKHVFMQGLDEAQDACFRQAHKKVLAVGYRSRDQRRGINVAFKYTVLNLSFTFLFVFETLPATYIWATLYIKLLL